MKNITKIFADYYPNRLAVVYIIHSNWVFKLGYNIIKPFLNFNITNKTKFIAINELKNYFNLDSLL
jgi:hypothetical protein